MSLDHLRAEPLETKEQHKELLEQFQRTRTESSTPVHPTHVLRKEGRIIGSFCLGSPTVLLQMDREYCTKRDSLGMWSILESLMLENRITKYLILCEETSPFHSLLDKRLPRITGDKDSRDWHLFERDMNTHTESI
jgi:hypothetical protein